MSNNETYQELTNQLNQAMQSADIIKFFECISKLRELKATSEEFSHD